MLNLKSKIYNFGLYGKTVSHLTREELKEAFESPDIEIIPHKEVENLRDKFTYKPLNQIKNLSEINSDCIVRLRTSVWRECMFRNKTVFRNKEYLLVFDYLLRKDYVKVAEIRQNTNINPKTMHYICKKLKEQDMIEEISEGTSNSIRIKNQDEKLVLVKNEKSWLTKESFMVDENESQNIFRPIFYNNLSIIDQLKLIVRTLPEGCDSRQLRNMIGMKPKSGLKMMQKICAENDDYCMAPEIEYKSNVYKFYYKPLYEEIIKKRIEKIQKSNKTENNSKEGTKRQECKNEENKNEDTKIQAYEKALVDKAIKDRKVRSISRCERQMALKVLANKYGSFMINKEILDELCEMTGYKYRYDRKTIIRDAKNAGLEIMKQETATGLKCEISATKKEKRDRASNEIIKLVKKTIVEDEIFVRVDNGSFLKEWDGLKELYFYIVKIARMNGTGKCDLQELILELPIRVLYGVSCAKIPNLRYLTTYEIWKKHKDLFGEEDFFRKNKLFWRTEKGEVYLDDDIYKAVEYLNSWSVCEYLKLIDEKDSNSVFKLASLASFLKIVKRLENVGLLRIDKEVNSYEKFNKLPDNVADNMGDNVNIEQINIVDNVAMNALELSDNMTINAPVNEMQKIYLVLNKNQLINEEIDFKIFEHKNNITMTREYVEYNRRKRIYYMLINREYSNFEKEAEEMIRKESSKKECEIFLSKLFRKKIKMEKKNLKIDLQKENDKNLYLTVKNSVLCGEFDKLKKSGRYSLDELRMVIAHMAKSRIISRHYISATLVGVKFSVKFFNFFRKYYAQPVLVEEESIQPLYIFYFGRILKTVENSKSIDFDLLLRKMKYLEYFELQGFLDAQEHCFDKTQMEEFTIISLKEADPFL